MDKLYLYCLAFLPHWWPLMTAGGLFGVEEVARRYWPWAKRCLEKIPPTRRRTIEFVVLLVAVLYAGYAAWNDEYNAFQDEHNARKTAEDERDEARRLLNASTPSELQKRIDELEAEKNAMRWTPLTPDEISALQSQLSKIEPEPVVIACETLNCKELVESFVETFRKAGWNDVKTYFGGGMGVTGVTGLVLEPGDERTAAIIAAIENATTLKVQPPSYDRSQVKVDPGIFFVIGAKPF